MIQQSFIDMENMFELLNEKQEVSILMLLNVNSVGIMINR